jgi:hypothetical protein
MLSLAETDVEKALDEIDAVRILGYGGLMSAHSEVADRLSDDFWRVIDLSTKPGKLSSTEENQLAFSIAELNDNYSKTERLLGRTSLLRAYGSVAAQINDINQATPDRAGFEQMYAPLHEGTI